MTHIRAYQSDKVPVSRSAELAHAPRLVVHVGTAPDGLPWLLAVDRSHELDSLFGTVCRIFGLQDKSELPDGVREALDTKVASGLMGVHSVSFDDGPRDVYVSRRKVKHIIGPTILSQLLDEPKPPAAPEQPSNAFITNVGAVAASSGDEELIEAVERSIGERQSKRHLLIELESGNVHTGAVADDDKVLRTPGQPFRAMAPESLESLSGVQAVVGATSHEWRVDLGEWHERQDALLRAEQSQYGGSLVYELPRLSLLQSLAKVARNLSALHASEHVHCDIAPGNVLLCKEQAISFDSLDVPAGMPATAATFEWAAPEQIVGLPVDPRTDVYSLGRMATALMGGVSFGEETHYVVPIGGQSSRRVKLLKSEGVFIDILGTDCERGWQVAWQDLLGRATSYDRDKRPSDAGAFADELSTLLERHPPAGTLTLDGAFGEIVHMESGDGWTFARAVQD